MDCGGASTGHPSRYVIIACCPACDVVDGDNITHLDLAVIPAKANGSIRG